MVNTFKNFVANSKAALAPFAGDVGNAINTVPGIIKITGDKVATNMANLLTQAEITSVVGKFTTLGADIKKAVDKIPADISNETGSVTSAVNTMVGHLESTIQSQAVVNAFYSAGVNMMHGLQSGINAAAGQVATAAANAATAALSASQKATKTHSPSLLYAEEGRDWMLGLVAGIQGSKGLVQAAVGGVLPTTGHPPVGQAAGGGGITLHVNANFTINAPGGNAGAIKNGMDDAATQFAKATLTALRAGAGTVY